MTREECEKHLYARWSLKSEPTWYWRLEKTPSGYLVFPDDRRVSRSIPDMVRQFPYMYGKSWRDAIARTARALKKSNRSRWCSP